MQEVFLVVHRRRDTFQQRAMLRTWLYGITLHVVRNHRRGKRRKPLAIGEAAEVALANTPGSEQQQPDSLIERKRAGEALQQLFACLPHELRDVLVMAELEQLSGPDIAKLTGLKTATVYGRLKTARAKFNAVVARHIAKTERNP